MHYHISTGVGIFNVFPSVVAASSVQRSQSTICSHCDYTYIHVHTLKYTNAHKRVNIKVCITCFSSYFRLRVLQTTALPVYVCEHLALALSHLDSLRHAGETNTNAIPGSRQRLSSLSWPHLPPLLTFTAPPQRQLSRQPCLLCPSFDTH